MQEYPPVVMLNPAQVTPPPLADFAPIISLTPIDRRKAFFILFSENLRTLDGNAAFLYGVNLVVAPKDLGAFQQIYREAYGYHERLYARCTRPESDRVIKKKGRPKAPFPKLRCEAVTAAARLPDTAMNEPFE